MFASAKSRNVLQHKLNVDDEECDSALKLFFISDIHRRKIDTKLLNKIGHEVDMVIIGGDLAEKGVTLSRISKNVCNLSKLGPVYYIWGNNDREAGEQGIRDKTPSLFFQSHLIQPTALLQISEPSP